MATQKLDNLSMTTSVFASTGKISNWAGLKAIFALLAMATSVFASTVKTSDWAGLKATWQTFLGIAPLAHPQEHSFAIPGTLRDSQGAAIPPAAIAMRDGVLDFLPPLGLKRGTTMEYCMAFCDMEFPENAVLRLGVGADWWFALYVNGQCILDRLGTGNGCEGISPDNHVIDIPVHSGKNLIAVYVRSGSNGFRFAWDLRTDAAVTECLSPMHAYRAARTPLPKLLAGPWLMNPDAGSMSIAFITHGIIPGGIDLRLHGADQPWKRIWYTECGHLITRDDHHQIDLTGLQEGARYDYRVVLRDPATQHETILPEDGGFHTFRFPDRKTADCRFLAFGDLQFPRETRLKYIEDFYRHGEGEKCDFIVTLGDMTDGLGDFENDVARDYLQLLAKLTRGEQPIVFVRGNHELRGEDRGAWGRYFRHPSGNTYFQFRFGDTAFLVLDAWEDKPAMFDPVKHPYCALNDDAAFIDGERRWLADIVRSQDFRSASRRIVLSHYAYFSLNDDFHFQTDNFRDLAEQLFGGRTPAFPLALWLCGHTHIYTRSIPGTGSLRSFGDHYPPYVKSPDAQYTVAAVSGPHRQKAGGCPQSSGFLVNVESGRCTVRAMAPDGGVFDAFQVDDLGKLLSEDTRLGVYED